MSYIKIKSPISRNLTSGIKLSVEDAPKMYYDNDITKPVQTYDFYALDSNNANDVVMHLDLRDATKSVNPPAADYSDYYLYSSKNVYPGIPITIQEGDEAGDSIYSGIFDMLAIKKNDLINFGTQIGNGFTLSMWVKISHNNPNLSGWHGPDGINGYGYAKSTYSDLVGTISTSNPTIFGITMNRGIEGSRNSEIRGNTLFYIRSADSKYTTGFVKNNISNNNWSNLVWVGQFIDNKLTYRIYLNGQKVIYYPIDEEITSSSTWGALDNGLGFGLWSSTDSDSSSEFVSLLNNITTGARPNLNSSMSNRHGKFQISTFTLYRKPLTDFQIFSDYKYYKERYITT